MRTKISKARTVLSLAHSSEEATLFDFGLREARAGIDTSCLKDKKIEECDSCDITGKWHYEEESEEEGMMHRVPTIKSFSQLTLLTSLSCMY